MTRASVLREKGSAVIAIGPDALVSKVAAIITSRRIGAMVVEDAQGELVGIVNDRDVARGPARNARLRPDDAECEDPDAGDRGG